MITTEGMKKLEGTQRLVVADSFRTKAALSIAPERAVATEGLTVAFGDRVVLSNVTIAAEEGRVTAVVGSNGAGKSTLFKALTGMVATRSGRSSILGEPSSNLTPACRARFAFVPESHAVERSATVGEMATLRASVYPSFSWRAFDEMAAEFELRRDARAGELSRGERAGLVMALALAQGPELLLLDDPTLGLDPLSRRRVVEALLAFGRDRARSILLASHELADIERIADDVVVLAHGAVRATGEIESIVERARCVAVPSGVSREALGAIAGVLRIEVLRNELRVYLYGSEEEREATIEAIARLAGEPLPTPWAVSFEECAVSLLWRRRAEVAS